MHHAFPPADSLLPRPPSRLCRLQPFYSVVISAHSPPHELRELGSFSSSSARINAEQVRFCGAAREVADTQTGRDATVYSAGTTANLGEDRCSSTPVLPLPSFGSAEQETPGPGAERYWPEKLRCRVIWPPAAS